MRPAITSVGRAMVSLGIQATRGAYNHYRVLKVLAEVGEAITHSREIGRMARGVLLDRDDLSTLKSFGAVKRADADIRFTDTFGKLRRMGLLEYKGHYTYKVSPALRKELDVAGSPVQLELDLNPATTEAAVPSTTDQEYLYVTIKVPRYKWLEQHIGAKDSYFIGGAKVDKEIYDQFLTNNKDNKVLVALARHSEPEMPLWSKNVPIVKVEETID